MIARRARHRGHACPPWARISEKSSRALCTRTARGRGARSRRSCHRACKPALPPPGGPTPAPWSAAAVVPRGVQQRGGDTARGETHRQTFCRVMPMVWQTLRRLSRNLPFAAISRIASHYRPAGGCAAGGRGTQGKPPSAHTNADYRGPCGLPPPLEPKTKRKPLRPPLPRSVHAQPAATTRRPCSLPPMSEVPTRATAFPGRSNHEDETIKPWHVQPLRRKIGET